MGFLQHPKVLYFTRLGQLAFAIGFLILICWCGTHRGYWSNINPAIAVGVISSIFTFVVTGHGIFIHHRANPFAGRGKLYTFGRIALELFMILLWIGTVILMLKHKTEDFKLQFETPPFAQWGVTVAFAFVEIISFFFSTFLVLKEDHGEKLSKVTGGSNYV